MSFRRFAYLSKTDHHKFGLLEASSMADARRHLGPGVHVKITWLNADEESNLLDRERRWEIVKSIFAMSETGSHQKYERLLDIVRHRSEWTLTDLGKLTTWLERGERREILKMLEENGEIIQAVKKGATKSTQVITVLNSPEVYIGSGKVGACQPVNDSHEIKRLRKRVIELESQLEAMMGYPYSDAPDTTGIEGLRTMALLEGRERKQDPDSGERKRREVE